MQCCRDTEEETGVRVEPVGILGFYSDPGHIVAYSDGEIRQEYEVMSTPRPVGGRPEANDEASDVRWVEPSELHALDIQPTQWRQLNHGPEIYALPNQSEEPRLLRGAERYRQQYLHRVLNGYCGIGGTGRGLPGRADVR